MPSGRGRNPHKCVCRFLGTSGYPRAPETQAGAQETGIGPIRAQPGCLGPRDERGRFPCPDGRRSQPSSTRSTPTSVQHDTCSTEPASRQEGGRRGAAAAAEASVPPPAFCGVGRVAMDDLRGGAAGGAGGVRGRMTWPLPARADDATSDVHYAPPHWRGRLSRPIPKERPALPRRSKLGQRRGRWRRRRLMCRTGTS